MPSIKVPGRDIGEKPEYIYGFQKGVNTLQDKSLIDDHELAYHRDGMIVVDGITKRQGTDNHGSSSGSRVFGGFGLYTSDGERFMLRAGGTALQYYNSSNVPTNITGATMTASKRTEFAMARNAVYVENGTDPLVKITVVANVPTATTFTPLTTPSNVQISNQGSSGTTNYSYRVSAFNSVGETLASVTTTTTTGHATLSASNFNRVTWDAVSSASGYIIYGRKNSSLNGIGETKMKVVTGATQYDDTGVDEPSEIITPQEGNSTAGVKGSMIIYAMSRLFVAGDPDNPSRLSYGGSGTQIDDFSTAYSGGWVDVSKDDGDQITGIAFYQNKIIVFKSRSVWQFDFTDSGLPRLQLITNETGCISYRTIRIVNNDLWFLSRKDGRAVVMSLGNVANYFNALRTTERSLKISGGDHLDGANIEQLANACAYYFRNLYILSLAQGGSSTNNRCYVFDGRFNAWAGFWTNIPANSFFTYIDGDGNEDLYYCSDASGYVVKMFTGTDDNGTAVSWRLQTKAFMQKLFDQSKIYRNPVFWFKDVSGGTITGFIITDGVFESGDFNISPLVSGIGAGFDVPGLFLVGDSGGASTTSTNSDQPMEVIITKIARSIQFQLDDNSPTASFKFLGLTYRWLLLEGKPLPPDNRIRLSN